MSDEYIKYSGSLFIYRLPFVLKQFHDLRPALLEDPDLAIITDFPIQSKSLVAMPLLQERVFLFAHPWHTLARSGMNLAALENETFLLAEPTCRYRKVFEQSMASAQYPNESCFPASKQ